MNPINLHFEVVGRQMMIPIDVNQVDSRTVRSFGMGTDDQHLIHLGAVDMTATMWVSCLSVREKLVKAIKAENQRKIVVADEVRGIRVVRFETGWPSQKPRIVMRQHLDDEHGVGSYLREFNPCVKESTAVSILFTQAKMKFPALSMPLSIQRRCHVAGELVYVRNVYQSFVAVMANNRLAQQFKHDMESGNGIVLETNQQVRAFVIEQKGKVIGVNLKGLPSADVEKVKHIGLNVTHPIAPISMGVKQFATKLGWLELANHVD